MSGMRPGSGIHTSGHALFGMPTTAVGNLIDDIRSVINFSTKNILLFHSFCSYSSCRQ
jgi:hypothetical protein